MAIIGWFKLRLIARFLYFWMVHFSGGRSIYTHPTKVDQSTMQALADGVTNLFETRSTDVANYTTHLGYTNQAFPTANLERWTAHYYDDYDLDNNGTSDYNFTDLNAPNNVLKPFSFTYAAGKGPIDQAKGKPVATRVRQLESTASNPFLLTFTIYDKYGRAIQTHDQNHQGGWQRSLSKLDFAGRAERTELRHNVGLAGASTVNVYKTFAYDAAGRVLRINQQFGSAGNNDPWEKVVEFNYNELGQAKWKKIGNQKVPINGNAFLQKVDYRYNIRGWMTHINDAALSTATQVASADNDLFGLELLYNEGNNLSNVDIKTQTYAQYNGNIAVQKWKTRVDESATARQYTYFYDPANRITTANFVRAGNALNENFTMSSVSYDRNGNIKRLKQNGLVSYTRPVGSEQLVANFGPVDDLTYSYEGNRLTRVEDALVNEGLAGDFQENKTNGTNPDYGYDDTDEGYGNGNLTSDYNKEISSIQYNPLNLPTQIWFNSSGSNRIQFSYSAAGVKLRKEVWEDDALTSWTDYAGGFVYEKSKLQFFPTEEGRALNTYFATNPAGTVYTYEYHYKDHLGNLRLSFRDPKPTAYFRATMESENAIREDVQFANLSTTRISDGKAYGGISASLLSSKNEAGSKPRTLGPWKTLKVRAGDKIEAQVYANYTLPENTSTFLNGVSLATYLSTPSNVTGGSESGKNIPLLQLGISIQPVPDRVDNTLPKAYLRIEYFDESYQYISSQFQPVTVAAQGNNWELLSLQLGTGQIGALRLNQDGYVQIYVANESEQEVRFDSLEIAYTEAMVVQENHYSPFGNNLVGIEKQGQPDHKFQYNGKEKQGESGLNWIDYGARFYDPQLGRWHSVDPLAEKFPDWSPYNYALNNPIKYIDADGRIPIIPIALGIWALAEVAMSAYDAYETGRTLMDPNATKTEKAIQTAGFLGGLAAPGGGYGTAGKQGIRLLDHGLDTYRGLKPALGKLVNALEEKVAKQISKRGDIILGSGDEVRTVLKMDEGIKAADFVSISTSGKFNISEVKNSTGSGGAKIGDAITQLTNTYKALLKQVPDAKIGQIEINLPKVGSLGEGYSVSGNQLVKIIDGKKEIQKIGENVIKVNFY